MSVSRSIATKRPHTQCRARTPAFTDPVVTPNGTYACGRSGPDTRQTVEIVRRSHQSADSVYPSSEAIGGWWGSGIQGRFWDTFTASRALEVGGFYHEYNDYLPHPALIER
jgi:hypothetical protein